MRSAAGPSPRCGPVRRSTIAIAALALLATACGSVREKAGASGAPLLTPEEAQTRTGLASVQGFFWARPGDDQYRLCATELDTTPPQCGQPALDLDVVEVTELAGVEFSRNVFWADDVRISGIIKTVPGLAGFDEPAPLMEVQRIDFNSYDSASGLSFRVRVPLEAERGQSWVALLTNSGPNPVEVTFPTGQSADVILNDPNSGAEVYRWSANMAFTQVERKLNLSPGQTEQIHLIDQLEVSGGLYELRGLFSGNPSPASISGRIVVR